MAGFRTVVRGTIVLAAVLSAANVAAPVAFADSYGQPCSDNALVTREVDANATVGSPPLVCAGTVWKLAPDPQVTTRQTLGAHCTFDAGTTAVADDPESGSTYFAMCFNGVWAPYRP